MTAVLKRELASYFNSMTGYVFAAFTIFITGIYIMIYCFKNGYPYFEYVVKSIEFFYLITIPVLTMRAVAEEKRQKTDQLLYALPLSMTQIVIGKYLAMAIVLLVPVAELFIMPVILSNYGNVVMATSYSSIFAYYLLGLALAAIGLFISSLTENQLVAAVITFVAALVCYLMTGLATYIPTDAVSSYISFAVIILLIGIAVWFLTKNKYAAGGILIVAEAALFILYLFSKTSFEGLLHKVLNKISLFAITDNFIYGIFDLTAVVYFITVIFLFIFLAIQSMEKRRWS